MQWKEQEAGWASGEAKEWGVSVGLRACVFVSVYFPPLLVSRLLITVREKNILGQHVE